MFALARSWFFWILVMFLAPLITMRMVSEEAKSGMLEFLLTAPVGCGDSDSGDDELPLAQYCPELLKVFCEKRIACYSA